MSGVAVEMGVGSRPVVHFSGQVYSMGTCDWAPMLDKGCWQLRRRGRWLAARSGHACEASPQSVPLLEVLSSESEVGSPGLLLTICDL